jgi:hypothetical protein
MLKIKDNVDLDELEHYGFDEIGVIVWNKELANGTYINVDSKTRIISFHHWAKTEIENIDILFDLIHTGFVEKI